MLKRIIIDINEMDLMNMPDIEIGAIPAIPEKQRGKLIVLEGVDGSGKTWVIDHLIQKYPDLFIKFPFPTFSGKQNLKERLKRVRVNDLESVLDYHFLFLDDIINHQPIINDKLDNEGKHILLDRYYFSTICYLKNNIHKLFPSDADFVVKWQIMKEKVLYPRIDLCIPPDNVILMTNNFKEKDTDLMVNTHTDLTNINGYFKDEIMQYHEHRVLQNKKTFDWIEIESFAINTFELIEEYLAGHDILNIPSSK